MTWGEGRIPSLIVMKVGQKSEASWTFGVTLPATKLPTNTGYICTRWYPYAYEREGPVLPSALVRTRG